MCMKTKTVQCEKAVMKNYVHRGKYLDVPICLPVFAMEAQCSGSEWWPVAIAFLEFLCM